MALSALQLQLLICVICWKTNGRRRTIQFAARAHPPRLTKRIRVAPKLHKYERHGGRECVSRREGLAFCLLDFSWVYIYVELKVESVRRRAESSFARWEMDALSTARAHSPKRKRARAFKQASKVNKSSRLRVHFTPHSNISGTSQYTAISLHPLGIQPVKTIQQISTCFVTILWRQIKFINVMKFCVQIIFKRSKKLTKLVGLKFEIFIFFKANKF